MFSVHKLNKIYLVIKKNVILDLIQDHQSGLIDPKIALHCLTIFV